MIGARAFVALTACILGGCSDDYGVNAVAQDGRIAFIAENSWLDPSGWVGRIEVRADNGLPTTSPEPGDDYGLVELLGVYWSTAADDEFCHEGEPIFYGVELGDHRPANFPFVAPKPLEIGAVYEVWTTSREPGSGRGWFKILPGGQLENYTNDPTPTLLDENGWQVVGGQQEE